MPASFQSPPASAGVRAATAAMANSVQRILRTVDVMRAPEGVVSLHLREKVSHLLLLGLQVTEVGAGRARLQRQTLHDLQAVPLDGDVLLGIVGQQTDLAQAQVVEDLRADAVVA